MPVSSVDQELAIQRVVVGLLHDVDGRHWEALQSRMADEVVTDYRSLFGGDVQRQPASALIAAWKQLLGPLDATQHLLGPIAVSLAGGRAVAETHVRGYHVKAGAPGGVEWMIAGHYVFELGLESSGWRIHKITLQTYFQTGNRSLLTEAAGTASVPAGGQ